MILLNFVRALIVLMGLVILGLAHKAVGDTLWMLPIIVVVTTAVFTIGDLIETKILELFNPENT